MRLRDFLIWGAWWGVVAGFLEVAKCKYSGTLTLGDLINNNEHLLWMAPAGNALVFTLIGGLLYLLRAVFPPLITQRRCVFVFIFMACLNVLMMINRLHFLAVFILSVGLAKVITETIVWTSDSRLGWISRTARWVIRLRPKTSTAHENLEPGGVEEYEIDRRSLLITAGLAVGAPAIAVFTWIQRQERKRLTLLSTSNRDKPNVLLLVLDTVRARNLSLYGYQRQTTPHLDRFAARGACFEWAIAEAPWTLPSHASMFTGQHAHDLTCSMQRPLNDEYPTLAEVLAKQGYATAGFVANTTYCAKGWGLGRGFNHYEDIFFNLDRVVQSSNLARKVTKHRQFRQISGLKDFYARPKAPLITDRFLNWIDGKQHRPFFAFLNYFDAHSPYLPPAPFDSKFGPKRPRFSLPFDFHENIGDPNRKKN